jgi:hypothetical protein
MKSKEEIEQLALGSCDTWGEHCAFVGGYTQCQKDNDWTKDCKCESSIGQTWCCNQCGLPYDTRKSKTYTEQDMLKLWNTLMVAMTNKNPIFFKDYINSLNKQD